MRPRSRMLTALPLLLLLLHLLLANPIEAEDDYAYQIPNPFKQDFKGYYYLKSLQTSVSMSHRKWQFEVEDYFSLRGISFSLHRDREHPERNYALVADGPSGKSYLVRNFDSPERFECELDHLHHHRQVFPWQYVFDVEDTNDFEVDWRRRSKRKRKNGTDTGRWAKRRYVYGAGAIWLNAIERKIVTTRVGEKSIFPGSNYWELKERDLTIKLVFDKPTSKETKPEPDGPKMQALLEQTSLNLIELNRQHSISRDSESRATLTETQFDYIVVKKFDKALQVPNNFKLIMEQCRDHAIHHRTFPNLMRSISSSPSRLFNIDYIERRFPKSGQQLNKYVKDEHRYSREIQYKSEWFSFKLETQVNIYENIVDDYAPLVNDTALENPIGDSQVDVFMKKFTANEKKDPRKATVHYHFIERSRTEDEGEIIVCHVGEHEPLPNNHLMSRTVHFARPKGERISGRLTGLGALVMNAADMHYKQFDLVRKKIWVNYDPFDVGARIEHEVEGWEMFDPKLKRKIHFYFTARENHYDEIDIDQLVRVEIREAVFVDLTDTIQENNDESNPNSEPSPDMLVRYDIIQIQFDASDQELDFLFNVPKLCLEHSTPGTDGVNDKDDDIDDNPDDYKDDTYHEEDYYNNFSDDEDDYGYDSDDTNSDGDEPANYDEVQSDGEDFEFEPGKAHQVDTNFPNFYEYLDGQSVYTIQSKISVLPPKVDGETGREEDEKWSKHVHLLEQVNLESEMTYLALYYSDKNLAENRPDLEFYINYKSELVFRRMAPLGDGNMACQLVPDVEPWLRLLSAPLKYYKIPANQGGSNRKTDPHDVSSVALIESSKIPMYGVGALWRYASESENTDFMGIEKKLVIGPDDKRTKRVRWLLSDEPDMPILFQFLLDVTNETEDGKGRHHHYMGRAFELLKLDMVTGKKLENYADPIGGASKFPNFKLSSARFLADGEVQDRVDHLPDLCLEALSRELQNPTEQEKYLKNVTKIPSFFDFIKETNAYTIDYDITFLSEPGKPVKRQPLVEFFDRNRKLGLIQISHGDPDLARDLYIDARNKKLYLFSEKYKICKRVTEVNPLPEFNLGRLFDATNEDFDLKKMFGLSAFWIYLSSWKVNRLHVSHRHDNQGNLLEVHRYEPVIGYGPDYRTWGGWRISITFVQYDPSRGEGDKTHWMSGVMKTREELPMRLEQIELIPIRADRPSKGPKRSVPHRIMINVHSIFPVVSLDETELKPPSLCESLPDSDSAVPNGNPSNNTGSAQFPQIMELIKHSNQFHMRSEIIGSLSLSKLERVYIMDEFLYHRNIRLRTYGLKNNLDVLVYGQTSELFDLSKPYTCSNTPPKLYDPNARLDSSSNLLDFWSDPKSPVQKLAQLYYSPVSLWYLAERNLANVKLVTSVDLAPQPLGTKSTKAISMERELRTETWRVQSPEGTRTPWSYDMIFEKLASGDREWHVLRAITITDTEYLGLKRNLEIEVINYRYDHSDEDMMRHFMIPEGYNCKRNLAAADNIRRYNDELKVDLTAPAQSLWYEASLELVVDELRVIKAEADVDSGEFDFEHSKRVLPTLLGDFVSTGGSLQRIFSHYSKVRYLNGSLQATREVYDEASLQLWRLDLMTGLCQQGRVDAILCWTLKFPLPAPRQQVESQYTTVELDTNLFNKLFLNTKENNFNPINWYISQGLYTSSYELSLDNLKVTDTFTGPVTIVRRFQHRQDRTPELGHLNDGTLTKVHQSIYTKVLMFDQKREKLLAIFKLALGNANENMFIKDVLRETTSTLDQCYNDPDWDRQVRSFVIDYTFDSGSLLYAKFMSELLEEQFLSSVLMKQAGLLMLQLDGKIRLEFDRNGRARFYFNLLEGLSAIEYFDRRNGFEMSEKLQLKADVRITSGVLECSRSCDQLNCVAMSYCAEHTCKLVTMSMISDLTNSTSAERARRIKHDTILLEDITLLDNPIQNDDCSYFYRNKPGYKNLDHFKSFLDQIINKSRSPVLLQSYMILIDDEKVLPSSFAELTDSFLFAEEDSGASADRNEAERGAEMYRVLEKASELASWQLMDLLGKVEPAGSLRSIMGQAGSYVDCLDNCKANDCMVASFCKRNSACNLVVGSPGHFREVLALERTTQAGCTLIVRDFLLDYLKFDDTRRPVKFSSQLEAYSPLECAAACKSRESEVKKCLSFDYCSGSPNTCYLQEAHVMMDEFDRSLLAPKWHNQTSSSSSSNGDCEHYSRNLLADFTRLPNKKLVKKKVSLLKLIRGKNSEACALDCHLDDQCQAFEYCFNERSTPVQACYFAGSLDSPEVNGSLLSAPRRAEFLEKGLRYSKKCSVFVLDHERELFQLDSKSRLVGLFDLAGETFAKHRGFLYYLATSAGWILAALTLGSIIQFLYIRLFGAPLLFSNY